MMTRNCALLVALLTTHTVANAAPVSWSLAGEWQVQDAMIARILPHQAGARFRSPPTGTAPGTITRARCGTSTRFPCPCSRPT